MMSPVPNEFRPWLRWNIPLVTFFARTWILLLFVLVSNYLPLDKHEFFIKALPDGTRHGVTLFEMFGAVLYVPAITSAVMYFSLLWIHVFFRDTIDKDAHSGAYIADWTALTPFNRVLIGTIVRVGWIIAFCILCASMARG